MTSRRCPACPVGIGEDFPIDGPPKLYGATKLAAEVLVQEYRARSDFRQW